MNLCLEVFSFLIRSSYDCGCLSLCLGYDLISLNLCLGKEFLTFLFTL